MSRRPYVRDILDVSYLPLIAASVIQAEDKRGRNKIRTGSTGLPYSPLRRAPSSRGSVSPRSPAPSPLEPPHHISCTLGRGRGHKPDVSRQQEHTLFPYYEEKLRVSSVTISSARGFRKIEGASEAERFEGRIQHSRDSEK